MKSESKPRSSGRSGRVQRLVARICVALLALFAAAPVMASVDLVLNHTDTGYDPTPAGGIVQYTLRIDNNGSTGATGVVLTDTLPSGVTFVGTTSTQGSCGSPSGGVFSCNVGSIVSLGTTTITVQVRAQTAGLIINSASATSIEADTDTSNNLNIIQSTTITQGADLALTLTPSATTVASGSSLSYTLSVLNNGPDTATNVQVSGSLPPGFVVSGGLPAGCSVSGQLLTCNLAGSIASGATTAVGPVNGVVAVAAGSTLTYAATVAVNSGSAPQDPVSGNNTDTVHTSVTAGSDLAITKTASASSPVLVGATFNYTLTPTYSGDVPTSLVVSDNVPSNFSIVSPASFNSNGWACTVSGQAVSCTRASGGASPGSNVGIGAITIQVTAQTAGANVTNQATISGAQPDPDSGNNTGQVTLTVALPTADLHAYKTGPNPALASTGSHWNWTIQLGNDGPAPFVGTAIMTDTLPIDITLNSYTLNGWSCSPAAPFTAAAGSQTITCSRDYTAASPLASGAKAPAVVYDVSTTTLGSYTNTMCVSSAVSGAGDTPPADSNSANNCASSSITVQAAANSADLQLFKSAGPTPVPAGDVLTYTLQIVNAGPATSNNVVLSDSLASLITSGGFVGSSVTLGSATASASPCTPTGSANGPTVNFSCTFTTVPMCTKDSDCPVVTIQIRPGGNGGSRTNTALVNSTVTADPDYSNNTASVTSQVDPRADMTVTKTVTPTTGIAGQPLTYVITALNSGPSQAAGVTISDTLPLDVTFVSASPSSGTCGTTPGSEVTTTAGNRTLACSLGSVNNNATKTVTVVVRPNTVTRNTTITNNVSVATTTIETDSTNNTAFVDVPVSKPVLDLLANVVDTPDPVAIGDQMTYTLTATNNGPSYAENVQFSDVLPAALLSYVSVSPPAGVTCNAPVAGSFGATLTCTGGSLAPNASVAVTVTLLGVNKGTTQTTLTVSSDETAAGDDTLPANNTVTEKTTVRPKADVAVVSKTAVPGTVGLREGFNYQIAVTNHGPGVADGTVVSDSLPAGMRLTGTPTIAPGSAGDFPSLGICTGTAGSSSFSCALGDDVAVNATALITVPVIVTVAPSGASPGTLTNSASITTTSKDEVPGNNTNSGPVSVQTATLSGRVYGDSNGNGILDGAETGIAGVTVKLAGTAPDGTAVNLTGTTASDGSYSFTKLAAGSYTVTETQPSGWLDGQDSPGTAGGSAAAQPGDQISGVVLASSTVATGYNFGELSQGAIGGQVYRDLNNDGIVSGAGETGISGVTVALSGTDDLGATINLSTTSDSSGNYNFGGLRPGTYSITETQPAGFLPGKATTGTGTTAAGSAAADGNSIGVITLSAGQTGLAFNFGELPPVSLAGAVYIDANRNGVRDPGETAGIANVTITLTGTDDLGAAVSQTTSTDGAGAYAFSNLRPGSYSLTESQPAAWDDGGETVGTVAGTARGALGGNDIITSIVMAPGDGGIGYNFGELGQGLAGFVYADTNGNGIKDAGEPGIAGVTVSATNTSTSVKVSTTTDASGAYLFSNLPAATYRIDETQPSAYLDGADQVGTLGGTLSAPDSIVGIPLGVSQVGTNYNFGERGGSLAGAVYVDSNLNGVRDAGEPGIAGVTVTLTGNDVNGATVSQTQVTDASGGYLFVNLLPANGGGYTLTETQPGAYADGDEHVGTLGGSAGASGTSVITGIATTAGAAGTGYDFGERTGALSGVVYADSNNNGIRDAGEIGIAGTTIHLTGQDVSGNAVNLSTVTAADGSYSFIGLSRANASGYTLTEVQPATYLDGQLSRGLINGSACAACDIGTANQNGAIPFDPAAVNTAFDFGELVPASLAGHVYDDINSNNIMDAGEGLAGVIVTLTGTDDLGKPVTLTTTSGTDGSYQFEQLRPGTYTVTETQPAGLGDVGVRAGNAGGSTGVNTISAIVLAPGKVATDYDFIDKGGILSGLVYFDSNGNGQHDAGEPGIAGVTVTLSGDSNQTRVTGADGSYQFAGLVGGNYAVTETQPVLYKDGGVQVGTASGTPGVNTVTAIVLGTGAAGSGYNFPELTGANGGISGSIWLNQPGGGESTRDPGEPGLVGWHVMLYRNGQPVAGVAAATTDASGNYTLSDVPAQTGYEIRFVSPNGVYYGYPYSQDPDAQWNGTVDRTASIPSIVGVTVGSAITVTRQDLPIDPSGVVYDSVTRNPVPGARVTLIDPSGQPIAAQYLLGGSSNVTQTTAEDGFYQFLLLPGAPAGTYTFRIEVPTGYLPPPSSIFAPTAGALTVPAGNVPYRVSDLPGPPATGALPPYYLAFVLASNTAGFSGNHIPIDPILQGALRVRKTTPKINVTKGDLVPYTIEVTNTLAVTLNDIAASDLLPPGFKYRTGSARIDGFPREPLANGRALSWPGLSFGPNQTRTVQLVLVIGTGVGEGEYTNQAWAVNTQANLVVSNIGTAVVRLVPDPTFDCADLIGKVFDDRNANGYQDQGEPGVPDVRLVTPRGLLVTTDDQGRYHVPCADVPQHARGANFVMKLDERSLPTGYRLTTENPGDVRLTAGKMAKLNFGVTIHRVVRLDVNAVAFVADGSGLQPAWIAQLPALYTTLRERPSVLRLAYHLGAGEDRKRVDERITALRKQITHDWNAQGHAYPLQVEKEIIEVQP